MAKGEKHISQKNKQCTLNGLVSESEELEGVAPPSS